MAFTLPFRRNAKCSVACWETTLNTFTRDASTKSRSCIDQRYAPTGYDDSAVVYPGFLSEEEGKSLVKEASRRMKRRRFEDGHWDSVITGYREVELSIPDDQMQGFSTGTGTGTGIDDTTVSLDDANTPLYVKVIRKTRRHLANHITHNNIQWLPCHAIDLSANGVLSAHIDSVKFSGEIVCGISLLSPSIMRLKPSSEEWDSEYNEDASKLSTSTNRVEQEKDCVEDGHVDLYLPELSLYVLSGLSRYSYTHELLPSGSTFELLDKSGACRNEIEVERGRRLSIIFRDALTESRK